MNIIVEVGTAAQKNLIEDELVFIQTIVGEFELNISQVIVPTDFDQTVNKLQNTDNYKSMRGVMAIAKVLEIDDGIVIILSPIIYMEDWDVQKRVFVYLHEILHVFNKKRIPRPEISSASLSQYFENIYRLFDEYLADRQALELIDKVFPLLSDKMLCHMDSNVDYFIQLINNQQYYEQISNEIASFRVHRNVTTFLKNTHDSFSEVAMSIVHLYPYIDNYPKYRCKETDLQNSKFVNNKTYRLIEFFRKKYEEKSFELVEGLNLVNEFMLNFGMRFEDTVQGLYCYVLDI